MSVTRRRKEGGTAVIEFAILAPVIFLLIFGVFEFGLAFRDSLTLNDAVADAARIGAVVGPDETSAGANADYEIISALREGMGGIPQESIERIVIFNAPSLGASRPENLVPTSCKNGAALANRCNVYDPATAFAAAAAADLDYFSCSATPSSPACSWAPESRDDGPNVATIDYIGVFVRINHEYVTGFFPGDVTIDRASVVRLEPGQVE